MKKRVLSLLLCIMLVVGMVPTTAFAAAGTWEVNLNVSESSEYKYNGQNTLALGFGVQSDDLKLKTAQSIVLAIDLNVLDFLQMPDSDVEVYNTSDTKLGENENALATTAQNWNVNVYCCKSSDGKTGYMQILASTTKNQSVTTLTNIATVYLGFKSGKSISNLTSTSIRLINKAEAVALEQSSAVMISDGNTNEQYAILADGSTDTLTGGVQVSWVGITPTEPPKPAYPGTIAAPTVKTNAGGKVELNAVTPSAGGTVKYGYSTSASTAPTTWQDSATFNGLNVGDTLYFYAKVEGTTEYQELVSAATSVTVLDKELTNLEITTPPSAKAYTHGDPFKTDGMKVKATYSDGSSNDNFTGYTVAYQTSGKGYLCKDNTKVTLKAGGKSVEVTGLTVKAKELTVTGLTAVDREYKPGDTLVNLTGGTLTGVVSGETVSLHSTPTTGRIDNAGVGNGKDVAIDPLSLAGFDSGYYTLTQPTGIKVNITRKNISGATISLGTQKTYNGSEQDVVISKVTVDGTDLTAGSDYTITSGDKATNVGDNTLVIEGKGNYTGTARATWTLLAKDVTITPTSGLSKTYGAADPTLTYTTDIDGDATLKGKFDTAKSGKLLYTGTDVGAYPITLGSLAAGNNFNLKLAAATVNFTINKATPSITATSPRQLVKNGVEVDISNWASFDNTDSGAKLTYALDGAPAGITLTSDNKLKADPSTSTTTFNIKVNAAATTNFAAPSEKVIVVNVVTKSNAGVSITTPPTSKTYGDADFTLTATKTAPDGGTWSWNSSNPAILEITSGANTATPTIKVKKADTTGATLTVTYTTDTHYGSANATITVAQKEVTVAAGNYKVSKEYDGTTTAGTGNGVLSVTGIVDSGVSVKATPVAYTNANVGGQSTMDVNITLDGSGNANYKIKGGAATVSVPCEITAKDVKLTGGINATDRSYVKDNKTVDLTKGTLTFDGLVGSETLDVNIPATGTISDAKVGAYNVTYSGVTLADGTGKASNYKLVSPLPAVMVNITKAAALTLADIPVSQKYTVTTGAKAIGTVMPADAGTLTYTKGAESKTGSVAIDSWAVDTTGKVTYTLSGGAAGNTVTLPVIIGSDNYENSTVNVVITLTAKENQAALKITGGETVVYGQTLQLGTSGGSGDGAVTYAVTNGTGQATIDASGKLTPVKVGTVKVKATKAEDANYNAITSAEVEITITRATPTGTPKYTAITTSGKTLADAGLTTTGSTLNPNAGTLVWVDNADNVLPDTTAVAANTTYKWLFTPTDTNYTTLTGSIELYHKSSSGGGGWYYTYYTIKATAGTNGSISPSGWTSVRDGRDQTFTITPDKGYAVAKVLVDGKSVGAVKSYTFKNVTKDHTIEAIFMKSNGNPQTGVFVMP